MNDIEEVERDLREVSIYPKANIIATQDNLKVISGMLNRHKLLENPDSLESVWACMIYVAETKLLARQTADQAEQLHNVLIEYVNKYRTDIHPNQ